MAEKKEKEEPIKKLKPKKKHGGGHHGGAWKVAYADFITTMMALFLLLWLLSASDQATKNIIAMYFKDPGIFDNAQGRNIMSGAGSSKKAQAVPISEVTGPGKAGQGGSEQRVTMEAVTSAIKKALYSAGPLRGSEQNVLFVPTVDGMTIQVIDRKEMPLFAPGDTRMTREGEAIITQIGEILALFPDFEVRVEGHTDHQNFPAGSVYTNWDLSLDRAQRAVVGLLSAGVPSSRIQSVAGYADTKPVNPDDPMDPRNRRLSIMLKRAGEDQVEQERMAGPERAPVATEGEQTPPLPEGAAVPAEGGKGSGAAEHQGAEGAGSGAGH